MIFQKENKNKNISLKIKSHSVIHFKFLVQAINQIRICVKKHQK
jgi:hypothetical protein